MTSDNTAPTHSEQTQAEKFTAVLLDDSQAWMICQDFHGRQGMTPKSVEVDGGYVVVFQLPKNKVVESSEQLRDEILAFAKEEWSINLTESAIQFSRGREISTNFNR